MAALICIKRVRGTFCQLVNIANRFLRIFSNIEASIRFIFPGGAEYPYLPTRLVVFRDLLPLVRRQSAAKPPSDNIKSYLVRSKNVAYPP